jgi:hypothetical protein
MEIYSIPLALEDFIPVILSSGGLFLIARMVQRIDEGLGRMAFLGWLLVTMGGLLKASWKLLMALSDTQTNVVWMDKGMFLWMAPGFVFLAFSVWFTGEMMLGKEKARRIWLGPGVLLGATAVAIFFTGFPDPTISTWRFILLGIMTIGNITLTILLIQKSRHFGLSTAAILFALNIILVFILNGMARMPEQTIPLQWTEQIINTVAQGAFLIGAWQLSKTVDTAVFSQESVTAS